MAGVGGIGTALERRALGSTQDVSQASKHANIYKVPDLPQRPFAEDYSNGLLGPPGEPLSHTIEGVPLSAEFVAGRRLGGGGDEGLAPQDIDRLARRLVGDVRPAVAREIGNDAGRYRVVGGQDSSERSILYSRVLSDGQIPNVLAHEIGHAADAVTGGLPLDGFKKASASNYNTGNNISGGDAGCCEFQRATE